MLWFNDYTHKEIQLKCPEIDAGDEVITIHPDKVDHAHE
jgi:hypothetical protein